MSENQLMCRDVAPAKRSNGGDCDAEAKSFQPEKRQKLAAEESAYYPATRVPINGWLEPCRYCRNWTGSGIVTADQCHVAMCRRCQLKLQGYLNATASRSSEGCTPRPLLDSDSGDSCSGLTSGLPSPMQCGDAPVTTSHHKSHPVSAPSSAGCSGQSTPLGSLLQPALFHFQQLLSQELQQEFQCNTVAAFGDSPPFCQQFLHLAGFCAPVNNPAS